MTSERITIDAGLMGRYAVPGVTIASYRWRGLPDLPQGTDNSRAVHDGSVVTSMAFVSGVSDIIA
ncbi:MAG: hypothetical protein LC808_35910 [Actinobacteria bacterium]|nr:hypothetical protein [Actinomycetota bacterium]